jgi:methyl-accepting chemotaxis protein
MMLLVGFSGVAVGVVGTMHGHRLVDNIGNGLDRSLDLISQSLDTAQETLGLTKTTLGQVNDGLDTVEDTAINVSQTISQTRPLLTEIGQMASHDVPDGLEAIQNTVPDIAQAAAVIDDTLTTLSNLHIEQTVLGFPILFDLGIDYAPTVPFEESINQIDASLEGIPSRLRDLEVHVDATASNLETISHDMVAISKDLDTINNSIADATPLIDDYSRIVTEVNDLIRQTRARLARQLAIAKLAVTIAMAWIGLAQVVPLHLGWNLLTSRHAR